MSYFKEHGKTLLAHHYMIVPIKQGLKRPVMDGWQNVRLTASDIPRFANQGVGILTGQGPFPICAVDIDVTDAELSHHFAEWCRDNLGVSCERVGNAPKYYWCIELKILIGVNQLRRGLPILPK